MYSSWFSLSGGVSEHWHCVRRTNVSAQCMTGMQVRWLPAANQWRVTVAIASTRPPFLAAFVDIFQSFSAAPLCNVTSTASSSSPPCYTASSVTDSNPTFTLLLLGTYTYVAYCYRQSSRALSVFLSVRRSVGNERVLWKNGYVDLDAVWGGGPQKHVLERGVQMHHDKGKFRGRWDGAM